MAILVWILIIGGIWFGIQMLKGEMKIKREPAGADKRIFSKYVKNSELEKSKFYEFVLRRITEEGMQNIFSSGVTGKSLTINTEENTLYVPAYRIVGGQQDGHFTVSIYREYYTETITRSINDAIDSVRIDEATVTRSEMLGSLILRIVEEYMEGKVVEEKGTRRLPDS